MDPMFFDGFRSLYRTAVVGALAYTALVVFLRLSGNRTLSKMNAFDLVVTVSLGSTLATLLLSQRVTLAQGVLALGLLIGMQFVVTWSSVRVGWIRRAVTGEPVLLLYRGALIPLAQRRARVTDAEVCAAVRAAGLASLSDAHAVVLETDGAVSVVTQPGHDASESSLADCVSDSARAR